MRGLFGAFYIVLAIVISTPVIILFGTAIIDTRTAIRGVLTNFLSKVTSSSINPIVVNPIVVK